MGICVTDTWLAIRHGARKDHPLSNIPITIFAAALASEILYRCSFMRVSSLPLCLLPLRDVGAEQTVQSPAESTLTDYDFVESPAQSGSVVGIPIGAPDIPIELLRLHPMKTTEMRGSRRHRKECSDPECRKKQGDWKKQPKKGSKYCQLCNKGYCENTENGRCCFFTHICLEYHRSAAASEQWRAAFKHWHSKRFDAEEARVMEAFGHNDE